MSERLFAFRWDVDHRFCVTNGIPPIRDVCRELGVRNTFFLNMGRSTNLLEWLRGLGKTRAKLADADAVHLIEKTGWPRFLLDTFWARPVGDGFPRELKALQNEGHELGLHGGMDHVIWSRRFAEIPDDVLSADVDESYRHFAELFGRPEGFASPGFYHDERVTRIVDRLAFAYDGDAIGGEPRRNGAHWTIPVTLEGKGTVPFLEYHGARGTPEADFLRDYERHLEENTRVVVYGHPCYEGVRPHLLRALFERALARGFRFVTLGEVASGLSAVTEKPAAPAAAEAERSR
jgi:peptidoglycan/xylan/chitin deacetylase (PgdA/CDA1 family)